MTGGPEPENLLEQLDAAEQIITRAIQEGGLDVEVAAAACAGLAGELTAAAAAARGLALAPLVRTATATLRRRASAAYQARRQQSGRGGRNRPH